MPEYEVVTEGGTYIVETEALEQELSNLDIIYEGAKQFGSGVVEGNAGFLGMVADLNPFQSGGPNLDFPISKTLRDAVDPLVAEEDPDYRYLRAAGEFVGPGGTANITAKGLKAANKAPKISNFLRSVFPKEEILVDAVSSQGAEFAEETLPDSSIAPIVGGAVGGVFGGGVKQIKDKIDDKRLSKSPQFLKQRAAERLKNVTDIEKATLSRQISDLPEDDLAKLMSTAEVTGDASIAQLEKELATTGARANKYAQRADAREAIRTDLIDSMSDVKAVNKEALGQDLIDRATGTRSAMNLEAQSLWSDIPRDVPIDIVKEQGQLISTLKQKQAGIGLQSKTELLTKQFLDLGDNGSQTSGYLQDIRSDALERLRDPNLPNNDARILSQLSDHIDSAMSRGLTGDDYDLWQAAREQTRKTAEKFSPSTAGGRLTREGVQPFRALDNALRGDVQSAKQLRRAVSNDPELIESVKRGLLDRMKTDTDGAFTPNKVKRFLVANDGAIKELLGDEHARNLTRIYQDLSSQGKVQKRATLASKGQSATAQKLNVAEALQDALLESYAPGSSIAKGAIKKSAKKAEEQMVEEVNDLLFEAALDPNFALLLLQESTPKKILSAKERLQNIAVAAGRGGLLAKANQEPEVDNISVITQSLGKTSDEEREKRAAIFRDAISGSGSGSSKKNFSIPELGEEVRTSSAGLDLLKKHEGLKLKPYRDTGGVPTVGYGHTGEAVNRGEISKEEAEQLLREDLAKAEAAVRRNVLAELTQNQFDALASFVYNVGVGAFEGSTLLRKLNSGEVEAVPREMQRWVYDNGKKISGLVKRRKQEAELFTGKV